MPGRRAETTRDLAAATALGSAFLALYGWTSCRTVYWYDSAELATAAATLGITHPPGYPVYTWVGWVFTRLPVEPAVAVNVMSGVFGALAVALTFAVGRQLHLGRAPAAVAAATLGASGLFWQNAVVAEVYCPAVACAALVTYLLLRGVNDAHRGWTLLGAWVAGVSLGFHFSIATLGLGFAWLAWTAGRSWRTLLAAAGSAMLGSTVLLWIPFRASQEPPLNVCDPSSLEQFLWYVTGGAYRNWFDRGPMLAERLLRLATSLGAQLGWIGALLAAVGAYSLARRQRDAAIALGLMAFGNIVVFARYQAHDVEVFLLPTTLILCCLLGCGVESLATRAASNRRLSVLALFALLPLALAVLNFRDADLGDFEETEPYLHEVATRLPADAVILNFGTPEEWKRHAVFGMYAQLVRGMRTDVRHRVAPDLRRLASELEPGMPVYAYAPVELLTRFFVVEPEGPLFRVVRPTPEAARKAPRKRAEARSCSTLTRYEVTDDR